MEILTNKLWPTIRQVVRRGGKHWVAAPFVATGAFKRLPLGRGDILVTRFDDQTIRTGLTNPREIAKYLRAGVEVHSEPTLHAKVYVCPDLAVVCSANVSANSEQTLIEAGVALRSSRAISSARQFVHGLRGVPVSLKMARAKYALYEPPHVDRRRGGKAPKPAHQLWIVRLQMRPGSPASHSAARQSTEFARQKLIDRSKFSVDEFDYYTNFLPKIDDFVVCVVRDGKRLYAEPPARVTVIERYRDENCDMLSVAVEVRKYAHVKSIPDVQAALATRNAKWPKNFRGRQMLVRSNRLRRALFAAWPSVAEFAPRR